MNWRQLLAAIAVVALVGSAVGVAATFALNTDADVYPHTRYEEDTLTIANHDRTSMGLLEYEDDNGDLQQIPAHMNGTEGGELVSIRADQLEEDEFGEYPRKDDEENNSASALDASEWATSGANASKLAVTQTDGQTAAGVTSVTIATDGTMAAGDVANASYSNQSIDTDVLKRTHQLVLNVDTLDTGTVVRVQQRDGTGDYVEATIDSAALADDTAVIANTTGQGILYQTQLGELTVQSDAGGDGTLDAIEEYRVVVEDGDADLTLTAVNVEKKSKWDFGTTRVLDVDGNYVDETVYQNADGGRIELVSLASLGSWADDTVIHQLQYPNVYYRMVDDPGAVAVEFSEAPNYPGYPSKLEITYRRAIPTGYDVTHGNIQLVTNQTFLSDRYLTFRYAEAVGDTATADVSWTDKSASLGEQNDLVTVDSTVNPGEENVFQFEVLLLEDQRTVLEDTAPSGGGGFWGDSGGSNPFASVYNWLAGGIVALLGIIGIKSRGG